ncbi:hypothetical protein ACFLU5_04565 [Bacteroidota bacterium]
MKRIFFILLSILIVTASCGKRPGYKTRAGKRKQNQMNMHQYDRKGRDDALIKNMRYNKGKNKKSKKKKYKF